MAAFKNVKSCDPRKQSIVDYIKITFDARKVTLLKFNGTHFSARVMSDWGDHSYLTHDGQTRIYTGFGRSEDIQVALEDIRTAYPTTASLWEAK